MVNMLFIIIQERRKTMLNKTNSKLKKFMKGEKPMKIKSKKGFGINEVIGIAAGVIIAAVVVIPGLRTFASSVMTELTTWWGTATTGLFS
jgi:hypothetical protein